jgi:quinol-cytochrome oxidoreductase complex cytochrome b subunit
MFLLSIIYVCIFEANFHLFQVTLGYNEQLYQALKDLIVLTATFFAGNKNTVLEMIAGILVVLRQKQYHPLGAENDSRPDWIKDDALNGPEWQKVKRYATLAMGMYYWPTYLFLSPRGPLVCIRKLDNVMKTLLKVKPHQF